MTRPPAVCTLNAGHWTYNAVSLVHMEFKFSLLIRHEELDNPRLAAAIKATFAKSDTPHASKARAAALRVGTGVPSASPGM
jgi:hypothetical protein